MARVVDELERDPAKAEAAEPAEASGSEYGNRSRMTPQGVFDGGHGMNVADVVDVDVQGNPRLLNGGSPTPDISLSPSAPIADVTFPIQFDEGLEAVDSSDRNVKKSSQLRRQLDSRGAARGAVVAHHQTLDSEWRGGGYDSKRQCGAVSQMKQVVGDAPDVQVREPPGPSASDDEQVGVLKVRCIDQRVGWITFQQDGPPPVTSVGKRRAPFLELLSLPFAQGRFLFDR